MAQINLAPYIFFDGQAKEAIEFYKSVFGGNLEIQTMADVPEEVRQQAGNPDKDRVMHAKLEADAITLYTTDSTKASAKASKIELCVMGEDEEKLRTVFDKLSEGGNATMPLSKQFWGDTFGMLEDKYGVNWMVNIASPKE